MVEDLDANGFPKAAKVRTAVRAALVQLDALTKARDRATATSVVQTNAISQQSQSSQRLLGGSASATALAAAAAMSKDVNIHTRYRSEERRV